MANQPNSSASEVVSHEAAHAVFSFGNEGGTEQLQETNRKLTEQLSLCTAELNLSQVKLAQSRQLSKRLQNSFEEERMRISREIHDQLGQSLTILKFDVSYLQNHLNAPNIDLLELQSKATGMIAILDDTIEVMRHIASDLRPSILDDLGLAAALEWQAKTLQTRTGMCCEVIDNAPDIQLDKGTKTGLFRMAQEALTNVVRHAQATQVHLTLTLVESDANLMLEIQDNGKGIAEPETVIAKSLGLLGMSERAHLLGGSLNISSTAGKGTTVSIRVPIISSNIQIEQTQQLQDIA